MSTNDTTVQKANYFDVSFIRTLYTTFEQKCASKKCIPHALCTSNSIKCEKEVIKHM